MDGTDCSKPFSCADFFGDMPWLNVPKERQGTFIAPLYPRGGLLGGSSDGAPKMSKLQALAAARKKKAQEQKSSGSSGVEKPMADLTLNPGAEKAPTSPTKTTPRGFPIRKRKDSNPHEKATKPKHVEQEAEPAPDISIEDPALDQAEPSAFANTMFSSPSPATPRSHTSELFSLPYSNNTAPTTADPFAGPSPDDVVIAAQSKGSTTSAVRPLK